jgi:hypothetical protein
LKRVISPASRCNLRSVYGSLTRINSQYLRHGKYNFSSLLRACSDSEPRNIQPPSRTVLPRTFNVAGLLPLLKASFSSWSLFFSPTNEKLLYLREAMLVQFQLSSLQLLCVRRCFFRVYNFSKIRLNYNIFITKGSSFFFL